MLRRPQPSPGLAMSSRRCWTLLPLAVTNVGSWLLRLPLLPRALHAAVARGGLTDHTAEAQGQSGPLTVLSVACYCIARETSCAFWLALHHGNTSRNAVACRVNGNNLPWGFVLLEKA